MIAKQIEFDLCQCRERKPLAVLRTDIGHDSEFRPSELRALAKALIAAAEECEVRPMGKRTYFRVRRSYPLA